MITPPPLFLLTSAVGWRYQKFTLLKSVWLYNWNPLWPNDAIRRPGTRSTLVQVMTSFLKWIIYIYYVSSWRRIWKYWTFKMPARNILSRVCLRLSQFSKFSLMQYMGCVYSAYPFLLRWLWEYVYLWGFIYDMKAQRRFCLTTNQFNFYQVSWLI